MFNSKVLEMCELLLIVSPEQVAAANGSNSGNRALQHMKIDIGIGMKPMMLFAGSAWEDTTSPVYSMLKSMLLDIFKGEETDKVDVEGLQYILMVAADEPVEETAPVIHLRWYKIRTMKSGQKLPRVELDQVGATFDFRVGRVKEADGDVMKEAMKQGKRSNEMQKTKKNVGMDVIGDKIGRVHLGKQDLGGLQTRKMKGLKRRAGVDDEDDEGEADADMMEVDEISEDGDTKRPKLG